MQIIYGINSVIQAIDNDVSIEKIYVANNLIHKNRIFNVLRKSHIKPKIVPKIKLDKLTKNNHQGVVALVSPIKIHGINDIENYVSKSSVFVILDNITDVKNMGAIVRSCVGFNVSGIIFTYNNAQVSSDVIQSSAGSAFNIPFFRVSHIKDVIYLFKSLSISIIASTEKSNNILNQYSFQKPLAFILGNESKGINDNIIKLCDSTVKIPISSNLNSYNVSVACAIVLYEIHNFTNKKGP
tara:strand:- start:146 stop:865 length:720 start_codon:yes stop_codon:yes gene_type:complete